MAGRGLAAETADRFGLGLVPESDADPRRYWGRMSIPYLSPTGVVQIRYRCLRDHHAKGQDDGGCPKFLGDAGEIITLYNAHAVLRPSPVLCITEGEPDVWAVETIAGLPAVGIPGVHAWQSHPYFARCFVGVPHLIFLGDGDDAGDQLADAVTKTLPEVHRVRFPDGDDANTVLARDPAHFRRLCGLPSPSGS